MKKIGRGDGDPGQDCEADDLQRLAAVLLAILGLLDGVGVADVGPEVERACQAELRAKVPGGLKVSHRGQEGGHELQQSPEGWPYHYVDPASGTMYMDFQPVDVLFA